MMNEQIQNERTCWTDWFTLTDLPTIIYFHGLPLQGSFLNELTYIPSYPLHASYLDLEHQYTPRKTRLDITLL